MSLMPPARDEVARIDVCWWLLNRSTWCEPLVRGRVNTAAVVKSADELAARIRNAERGRQIASREGAVLPASHVASETMLPDASAKAVSAGKDARDTSAPFSFRYPGGGVVPLTHIVVPVGT